MYRATSDCESEQQAAGCIVVVGIVLYDGGLCPGLLDFDIATFSLNGARSGRVEQFGPVARRRIVGQVFKYYYRKTPDSIGSDPGVRRKKQISTK